MTSPSRLRSGTVRESVGDSVDEMVNAVVDRLTAAGLVAKDVSEAVKVEEEQNVPSQSQRQLWLAELRQQMEGTSNYGTREKEEVKGLLITGEGDGPPADQQAWYWGRVRLFLIVAHHVWRAAVSDAETSNMDRLCISLGRAAAQRTAAPPPATVPPVRWRG